MCSVAIQKGYVLPDSGNVMIPKWIADLWPVVVPTFLAGLGLIGKTFIDLFKESEKVRLARQVNSNTLEIGSVKELIEELRKGQDSARADALASRSEAQNARGEVQAARAEAQTSRAEAQNAIAKTLECEERDRRNQLKISEFMLKTATQSESLDKRVNQVENTAQAMKEGSGNV